MKSSKKKKIALFHPWIKSKGGGEKVILEILKNKDCEVDLYTWVYDEKNTFDEFKKYKINILAPKIAEKISRSYFLRGFFFLFAIFSKIPLEKYDIFLISTSGLAELITLRNRIPAKTFAYVHTILRATYKEDKFWNMEHMNKNILPEFLYSYLISFYRFFERISWRKIDIAIFNSELSLERAKKHKLLENKKCFIVYPPVEVENFFRMKSSKENYFIYVSRIHPRKRQDLLIKSWYKFVKKYPHFKLIIAGNIENKKYHKYLRKLMAKTKNIEIKTNVDEKQLLNLYKKCFAGIFIPYIEDFGIVPFEILAMGKPLIVTDKGGYIKLISRYSQVYQIKESRSEKTIITDLEKALENVIKSEKQSKKIPFKNLAPKEFINNLNKIILK